MNVHRLLIPLLLPLLISGCGVLSFFNKEPEVKPVEIQTKAVEKTPLKLAMPEPFKSRDVKFIIITPENAERIFSELKANGDDMVLFGLTDNGYENLALTIAEVRNLLSQQRSIIIKYKDYYEPEKKPDTTK